MFCSDQQTLQIFRYFKKPVDLFKNWFKCPAAGDCETCCNKWNVVEKGRVQCRRLDCKLGCRYLLPSNTHFYYVTVKFREHWKLSKFKLHFTLIRFKISPNIRAETVISLWKIELIFLKLIYKERFCMNWICQFYSTPDIF